MLSALRQVQALRRVGVRYATEFSGRARVRTCPLALPAATIARRRPLGGAARADGLELAAGHQGHAHRRKGAGDTRRRRHGALAAAPAMHSHSLIAHPSRRHNADPAPPSHRRPRHRPRLQSLGIQMCVEATALGVVMSVWWRWSHTQEKALYDKYYGAPSCASPRTSAHSYLPLLPLATSRDLPWPSSHATPRLSLT